MIIPWATLIPERAADASTSAGSLVKAPARSTQRSDGVAREVSGVSNSIEADREDEVVSIARRTVADVAEVGPRSPAAGSAQINVTATTSSERREATRRLS